MKLTTTGLTKTIIIQSFIIALILTIQSCNKQVKTIADIDGNIYKTVQIGNQLWMAEDLVVTHYRNGDPVYLLQETDKWVNAQIGGYCYKDTVCKLFLYNWYAVNNVRGLAPDGWHIPTIDEIHEMVSFIGGDTIAGDRLKGFYSKDWNPVGSPSGLNLMPNGYRDYAFGNYYTKGFNAYLWIEDQSIEVYSWSNRLFNNFAHVKRDSTHRNMGFTVRCIQDPID